MQRAFDRAGVTVLDTHDLFVERVAGGENLYAPDGHWNPRGHALIAAAIRDKIKKLGWLQ